MGENLNDEKVWFVTGASKGLGLELVKKLLSEGCRVAATSRSSAALVKAVGAVSNGFLPLEVDLLNERSVAEAIDKTRDAFGRIDVIVNNAGYGQLGTLEELSDQESRENFNVNVFGVLNVIRHAMPHFRAQRSGHIFNISSIAGYTAGFPGWGIYCATKFAVAGLSESLAAEVKAFNVGVTVVYPGYFRTEFLTQDSLGKPQSPIAAYEDARQLEAWHDHEMRGNQPGDPQKAAEVLIKVAEQKNAPLHLFLGNDSFEMANQKIKAVQTDLENNQKLSVSTNFSIENAAFVNQQ